MLKAFITKIGMFITPFHPPKAWSITSFSLNKSKFRNSIHYFVQVSQTTTQSHYFTNLFYFMHLTWVAPHPVGQSAFFHSLLTQRSFFNQLYAGGNLDEQFFCHFCGGSDLVIAPFLRGQSMFFYVLMPNSVH